jgi:hypothetical protein
MEVALRAWMEDSSRRVLSYVFRGQLLKSMNLLRLNS